MKKVVFTLIAFFALQVSFAQVIALKTLNLETDLDESGSLKEGVCGENGSIMELWYSAHFFSSPEFDCLSDGENGDNICGELEINVTDVEKLKKLKTKTLEDMVLYIKVSDFHTQESQKSIEALYQHLKGLNISALAFVSEAGELYKYTKNPYTLNQELLTKINNTWGKKMLEISSQVYVWEYFR